MAAKKGIDISYYQGKVSVDTFKKIKNAGYTFVILRIGYTASASLKPTADSVFENNYANALKAGLDIGVYYYSLATNKSQAETEAKYTIEHLKNKTITYPVYIDVEDSAHRQYKKSKTELATMCDAWCNMINKAGYIAGVYASYSWFTNKIGTISATHTKWVAQYNSKCSYTGKYDMWQYTSSGKVANFSRVDMNYCYTDFNKTKTTTTTKEKRTYTGTLPKLPKRGYFKYKDTGDEVKKLQSFLNWYGNYKLTVDGILGKLSVAAIKKYQQSENLTVDGDFGSESLTRAKTFK